MRFFQDTSINIKTLIPPVIVLLALGVVSLLAVNGLDKQRALLVEVQRITLDRVTLVNELIAMSEKLQSDLLRISVLRFMNLPDKEIRPVHGQLEEGLNGLKVLYSEILTKWPLDLEETSILEQIKIPMDAFHQQARDSVAVVFDNPSFGILLVRSASIPFADFRGRLTELLNFQKAKISKAEILSNEKADMIRGTIIAVAILTAIIAILTTVLIGTVFISRPVRFVTDVMGKLANGRLSAEVGDLNRKDEIGSMARAVEVFRKNAIDKEAAEETLRDVKRRNQALLDHSPVCHKIVNLDFNLTYMSANGYKMMHIDNNADIYGKPYPFEFFPAAFRNKMTENLKKVKETGDTITMEALANDIEGNEVWLDSTILPVLDDDGRIDYITVVSANTTQRKRAVEEKTKLESQLQQSQKMESIGTLAGGIAHDFNNILGIILGNAELAMDDVPEWNPARKNLDEVKKACMRAKDVVRQILSFSRKSEIEQKSINIVSVVVESLKLSRASIPTSIEIRQDIANDVDDILGDPTQIHQIMINLCTNAAHAMENDGGILEVTLENTEIDEDTASQYPELNPGPYVHLRVSDTGDGIKPEVVGRVFDPYFTTKDVGKGTGMGLAVVHGIVKSHHGNISVESEPGKGTTFKILFPVVKEKVGDKPKEAQELPTGNERILFVDDEESMVNLNQQRLERLGYKVAPQTDSSEALKLFRSDPIQFDLVITDMTMPHMTGDRLAQEILEIRPDMPIIICTGYSNRITEESARELGIRKYIEKPIEIENLARSVREVLDGK